MMNGGVVSFKVDMDYLGSSPELARKDSHTDRTCLSAKLAVIFFGSAD